MRDFLGDGQVALIGIVMDVVAFVQESLDGVVDPLLKGLILEREAPFTFQAGLDLTRKFRPLCFGEVKVGSEIEEGNVSGISVDASGLYEGESKAFLAVFAAMGLGSDEHDCAGLCGEPWYACGAGRFPT